MEPQEYPETANEAPAEVNLDESLQKGLWEDAKKQGLDEKIREAAKEHPDLYWGSMRNEKKLFVFRPLYWDERVKISEDINAGERTDFTPKDLVELCVVVGLEEIVGKRARAGIWEALAKRIDEVGDYETDLPPRFNPPVEA